MKGGIYMISCIISGKFYIGSTIDFRKRFNGHKSYLRNNKHHNPHLQNAWNKYGEENFEFVKLEFVNSDSLILREQEYIDIFLPKYNIRKIAESNLGLGQSDKHKAYIETIKGKPRIISESHRENLRLSAKTRKVNITEKMRENGKRVITEYNKSDNHKKVASEVGKKYGAINIRAAHKIKKDKFTEITIKIFELRNKGLLGKEIATELGISLITVRRKLNGKRYGKDK